MIEKHNQGVAPTVDSELFSDIGGVFVHRSEVQHRDEEFDPQGFDVLLRMQRNHFWYLGRHKFLACAFDRVLSRLSLELGSLRAIDLGGGCGGWLEFLHSRLTEPFEELALGDSSYQALCLARNVVDSTTHLFQVDLLNLEWRDRWDVVFLLDVLEHIDDESALENVFKSLRPGGVLFVTAPALDFFWSYNDDLVLHRRRYSRAGLNDLAGSVGFNCLETRYFNFILSPLVLARKFRRLDVATLGSQPAADLIARTHRVPSQPLNRTLLKLFSIETPLGLWFRFPWGTSIMGVFQK